VDKIGGIMEIQDIIERLKIEICSMDVKYDAGKYKGMEDSYFEMKTILRNRLQDLYIEQKKAA